MKKYFYILILTLLTAGCASLEEEKDDAAESAREYIFENVQHISLTNYNYIKYTYPRILKNDLMTTQGRAYNQYYFAWDLPDPKITVLVYGTSFNDFRAWTPIRILFKDYKNSDYEKEIENTDTWSIRPTWQDQYYRADQRKVNTVNN